MIEPIFTIKAEKETADFGIFIIEPLQQGFGQTLGNALRRTLLSSLSGAAVVQVKIAGAKHEFGKIPGLKEDVVELILNIKKIRVKYSGEKPKKITVDKTGPGEVKAGDIEAPPEVEIVNKDLVLGTLADKKSRLKMEMVVQAGLGYSLAEERATDEIGVIAVDALFSPVVRVNYHVGVTRVGRAINWDKLTVEIWTNKTISPKQALLEAGKILERFFQQVVAPQPQEEKIGEKKWKEEKIPQETLEMLVEELELPTRIANSLVKGGFTTVKDVVKGGKEKLIKVKNLGTKSIKIIETALKQKGIELPA